MLFQKILRYFSTIEQKNKLIRPSSETANSVGGDANLHLVLQAQKVWGHSPSSGHCKYLSVWPQSLPNAY